MEETDIASWTIVAMPILAEKKRFFQENMQKKLRTDISSSIESLTTGVFHFSDKWELQSLACMVDPWFIVVFILRN